MRRRRRRRRRCRLTPDGTFGSSRRLRLHGHHRAKTGDLQWPCGSKIQAQRSTFYKIALNYHRQLQGTIFLSINCARSINKQTHLHGLTRSNGEALHKHLVKTTATDQKRVLMLQYGLLIMSPRLALELNLGHFGDAVHRQQGF